MKTSELIKKLDYTAKEVLEEFRKGDANMKFESDCWNGWFQSSGPDHVFQTCGELGCCDDVSTNEEFLRDYKDSTFRRLQ